MKRDDTLWKGILENLCEDFINFFFDDAHDILDFRRGFQFLDKELEQLYPVPENESAPKFVDKLVKVFTKRGKEEWILVHIEIQGYRDNHFAKRMFTYFYRIMDMYEKPVTAIAIFTDSNKKFLPKTYDYEFMGTRNIFYFNTYKIIEQDEEILAASDNPFAIVILTVLLALKKKNLSDDDLYHLKYELAKNLLSRKITKKKIDDLLIFLQQYVRFEDSDYNIKFDKVIDVLTEREQTMGIREMVLERAKKEGKTEGINAGRLDVAKKMLDAKKYTPEEISGLTGINVTTILEILKSSK